MFGIKSEDGLWRLDSEGRMTGIKNTATNPWMEFASIKEAEDYISKCLDWFPQLLKVVELD